MYSICNKRLLHEKATNIDHNKSEIIIKRGFSRFMYKKDKQGTLKISMYILLSFYCQRIKKYITQKKASLRCRVKFQLKLFPFRSLNGWGVKIKIHNLYIYVCK